MFFKKLKLTDDGIVNQSRVWLRDHCPIHLLALAPSTRKQFAAEKLQVRINS